MKPMNLILYVILILLIINCGQNVFDGDDSWPGDPDGKGNKMRTGYVNMVLVHADSGNPIADTEIPQWETSTNENGEVSFSKDLYVPWNYADNYYKAGLYLSIYRFIEIEDSVLYSFTIEDANTYQYELIPNECYYHAIFIFTNSQTGGPISNTIILAGEFYSDSATTDTEGRIEPVLRIPSPNPDNPCPGLMQETIWVWSEGFIEAPVTIVGTPKPEEALTYHVALDPE